MRLALFLLTIAALVFSLYRFGLAVNQLLKVVRLGQQDPTRSDNRGNRWKNLVVETLGHSRMLQWNHVGIAHWFVFVGFGALFFTLVTAFGQVYNPDFVLPLIGHWTPYLAFTEFIAVFTFLGIMHLIIVRQRNNPAKLERKSRFFGSTQWQAYYVEITIVAITVCVMTLRGLEGAYLGVDSYNADHWLSYPLVLAFSGLSETVLGWLITIVAITKIAVSLAWFLVISAQPTMGIAWHRFTAFFNIWFKRNSDGRPALGALQPMRTNGVLVDFEDPADDAVFGVGVIEEMTWKDLLDVTTCTECGRCQSQCPAWNTEKPLSPKLLVKSLRDHAWAKAPYLLTPEAERASLPAEVQAEAAKSLVGDVIDPDVLWSCTMCGACVQQCPVDIEHIDHIVDMRRQQVMVETNFPNELNGLFKNIETKGNPWGMNASDRNAWIKEVTFPVRVFGASGEDKIPDDVEWLFWVGCAGAFEDKAKKTTKAVAELLHLAGVEFMVLGDGETCTGDSARRSGNEFLYQMQAQANIETLNEIGAKKIVTTCPHCMNALGREYPQLGGNYTVVHHSQVLTALVKAGAIKPLAPVDETITYHDPCYLGRHNQVFLPPRDLLEAIPGAKFSEMEKSGVNSFCCGAGGARMWMEEKIGTRVNEERARQALATGASRVAVACPFCNIMLSDAMASKNVNAPEETRVTELSVLLLESVKQQ